MAKQTFTVGQVLTAAQLTSLQQTAMGGGAASAKTASYTLVAADAGTTISMTSTSATTITVNTGLFAAGDTVFIQNLGSGNLTITAGSATVATAGSLILPQNDAGILYFVSTSSSVFYDFIQVGAASPLTTKGDLYTFASSDTRIGVGANNTVLTADSAEATGLKWVAPAAGGGFTLLSTTTMSGSTTTISSINQTYKHLYLQLSAVTCAASAGEVYLQTGSGSEQEIYVNNITWGNSGGALHIFNGGLNTGGGNGVGVWIYGYSSTTRTKPMIAFGGNYNSASNGRGFLGAGCDLSTGSGISSLSITCSGTTFNGGTVQVYGVN